MRIALRSALLVMVMVILTGCFQRRGVSMEDLPTAIPSIDSLATSVALTQNAPPAGFRDTVSYDRIDRTLNKLDGGYYEVLLEFEGVFSQTNRATSGRTNATVWFNQVGLSRRVLVESEGELLQRPEGEAFEAVKLGPDAFLVQRGACLSNAEDDARTAANITAGDLIGGARNAYPIGKQAVVNGIDAWEYRFELEDISIPSMRFVEDTRITEMRGEMWVAPEYDVVVRYWVTMDVENARLLLNDLPVTGQLRLRYDLYDVNDIPNISVPFGC